MIIDIPHLQEYSLLPANFDLTDVINLLEPTEFLFVKPLLGDELYDEICEQVKNDNVSDVNASLLVDGGLWRYLACAFAMEVTPFVYVHFSQVGATKGRSENSDSADLKDITYLTSHLRTNLETYKKYTYNWLLERMGSYPKWSPNESVCGCSKPVTCCGEASFTEPEPLKIVYGLPRKNTDLS